MMSKIRLVQGDTRPQLVLSLSDNNDPNAVIDVSDAGTVVRFYFRQVDSTALKATIICGKLTGKILADGTINYLAPYNVPGAGGRVYVDWTPEALDTDGDFEAELEVTFADGSRQTVFNLMKFQVRPQVA